MMVMFFLGKSAAATVADCANVASVNNTAIAIHLLMTVLLCLGADLPDFSGYSGSLSE